MKGKCFSAVNRGQRKKSDFYQTPYSITGQLLEVEKFENSILEPCCGKGAIVDILSKHYPPDYIDCFDISNGYDFLKFDKGLYHNIITNPPFSLSFEFIQKSKEIYTDKIAMLLPVSYLHGQKRFNNKIFSELKCIYVFTRYPLLTSEIRSDGKYQTGMIAYAWYIWQKNHKEKPFIDWIDNNKYVIGSNSAQQPLSGSPEGSPKVTTQPSDNGKRCLKCRPAFE